MDIQQFQRNRQQYPSDQLAKYQGQYVAWSPDGRSILAAADDELQLAKTIKAAGLNTAEVLIAFVPENDEVLLGGGLEIVE